MGQMAADVNQSITLFGESVKHFFRDQQRSAMTSPMFNLPGRLVLGSYCYYENLPPSCPKFAIMPAKKTSAGG